MLAVWPCGKHMAREGNETGARYNTAVAAFTCARDRTIDVEVLLWRRCTRFVPLFLLQKPCLL